MTTPSIQASGGSGSRRTGPLRAARGPCRGCSVRPGPAPAGRAAGTCGPSGSLPRRTRLRRLSVVAGLCLGLAACAPQVPESLTLLSWNVQNLFDEVLDGNEYPEFRPADPLRTGTAAAPGAWDRRAYQERLDRLAAVIRDQAGLPDLVLLVELENRKVLEDLARRLPPGSYPHLAFQADPASPIHLGLLSRYPVSGQGQAAYAYGQARARPVWSLGLDLPGWPAVRLLGNHWKSRAGGDQDGPVLRWLAGESLDRTAARLLAGGGRDALLIACGDFNCQPEPEPPALPAKPAARVQGGKPFALCGAAGLRPGLRAAVPSVLAGQGKVAWRSAWDQAAAGGPAGSYWYGGAWERIDHILVAGDAVAIREFRVLADGALLDAQGCPAGYEPRTRRGVSDHLPLLIRLQATADPRAALPGGAAASGPEPGGAEHPGDCAGPVAVGGGAGR